MKRFTHINENNQPSMVNVGGKPTTKRLARARTTMFLPDEVFTQLIEGEINSPKGPVFATAIIAGTMAAKRTGDLIPFCHPIGIDSCNITIEIKEQQAYIESCVEVEAKTGIEMEALTACSIAALTIYDMCKALSSDMIIGDTRLIEKRGGKSDFHLQDR